MEYCKESLDQTSNAKSGNSRSPLKIHVAASDTGLERLSLFEEISRTWLSDYIPRLATSGE